MTERQTSTEAAVGDFMDELSDEAIDRPRDAQKACVSLSGKCECFSVAPED